MTFINNKNMETRIKIPKPYLFMLNQIFELEQKVSKLNEQNSIQRNIDKMKNIFETEPFKSYKEYFNISMVKAVSRQRYISDPHYSRDTYYGITLMDVSRVELSGNLAIKQKVSSLIGFDISNCTVVMVVNHDANMGCGGKNYNDVGYAFFSYSESFYKDNKGYKKHDSPVHEMGHAFAGLADEYAYGYSPSAEYIQYWQENYLTLEKNLNKSIQ
ncbi:MAG: hypothetical protein EOM11_10875, partial [Erysipelotrichia bacterium]|nr:hypothetical protein [Erysipelotrichia bacterium]